MTQTLFDSELLQVNDGSESADKHVMNAMDGNRLELPDDAYITNSDIGRDGMDLVLTIDDGSSVTVENYFSVADAPTLVSDSGKALSPSLVESFARDVDGVQYAEAGSSMTDASPVGVIDEISGDVTILRADGTVESGRLGSPIYQGDVIETSDEGAANLVFVDESSLAISEDARLAIDEYVFDPSTLDGSTDFSILQGVFVYTSGIVGREDPDDVTIDTPVGSIGIRGTIIAGDIKGSGEESQITVIEGAIVVRNDVSEVTLSQQYETVRISSVQQDVGQGSVIEAEQVQQDYQAVSKVAPTVFTSVQDNVQESQQDNNAPEAPVGEEKPAVEAEQSEANAPVEGEAPPQEPVGEEKPPLDGDNLDAGAEEAAAKEDGTTLEGAEQNVEEQRAADQQEQDDKVIQEQLKTEPETIETEQQSLLQEDTKPVLLGDDTSADGTRDLNVIETTTQTQTQTKETETKEATSTQSTTETRTSTETSPDALETLKVVAEDSPKHIIRLNGGAGVGTIGGLTGNIAGIAMGDNGVATLTKDGTTTNLYLNSTYVGSVFSSSEATFKEFSFIGDYNNDGNLDFVVGDGTSSGQAHIIDEDGNEGLLSGSINDGKQISAAGDLDGDGFDDYVYMSGSPGSGIVSQVSGETGAFADKSTSGFTSTFSEGGTDIVTDISGVGDTDNDGIDEFAVRYNQGGSGYAKIYESGSSILTVSGLGNMSGIVEGLGNFNGDTESDYAVQGDANTVYIVYGGSGDLNAANLAGARNGDGVVINTAWNIYSIDNVGDFNGDGFNDVAITTRDGDNYRINIVYGDHLALESEFTYNLGELMSSAQNGFVINYTTSGVLSLDGGSDLNGDGMDDLAVADTAANTVYVVKGRDLAGERDSDGIADQGHDVLRGGTGNDTLRSLDHQHVIMIGGDGNDTLVLRTDTYGSTGVEHVKLDGGDGNDTLRLVGTDSGTDTLDLRKVAELSSIEKIDMSGNGESDVLSLRWDQIFDMASEWQGTEYSLTIDGDSGDTLNIYEGGVSARVTSVSVDGGYDVYSVGSAGSNVYLYVDQNIGTVNEIL